MQVDIAKIAIGERTRRHMGDLDVLAKSIADIGLLQPIVITADYRLVCGERRLRAIRDILGRTQIHATIVEIESIAMGECDENTVRESFTPSERVEIMRKVADFIGNRQGHRTDQLRSEPTEVEPGVRTFTVAAKKAGFSSYTVAREVEAVVKRGSPELIADMDAGKVSVHKAYESVKGTKPSKPGTAPPVKPVGLRVVADADDGLFEQVCSLVQRLSEVSKKMDGDEMYRQFPARLRHNLDQALVDAAFFIGDLHRCWVNSRVKKNAAG